MRMTSLYILSVGMQYEIMIMIFIEMKKEKVDEKFYKHAKGSKYLFFYIKVTCHLKTFKLKLN